MNINLGNRLSDLLDEQDYCTRDTVRGDVYRGDNIGILYRSIITDVTALIDAAKAMLLQAGYEQSGCIDYPELLETARAVDRALAAFEDTNA